MDLELYCHGKASRKEYFTGGFEPICLKKKERMAVRVLPMDEFIVSLITSAYRLSYSVRLNSIVTKKKRWFGEGQILTMDGSRNILKLERVSE